MKAQDFLNEDMTEYNRQMVAQAKPIAQTIIQNCQPYLKQLSNRPDLYKLYRGLNHEINPFVKNTARLMDREPKNSPQEMHDAMNVWYTEHYNHPYRNGVFVTGSQREANIYGPVFIFFPIGNFEFLWNKDIEDVYTNILPISADPSTKWMTLAQQLGVSDEELTVDKMLDEYGKNYQTDDIKAAIMSNVEIMFWVKEYYAVSKRLWDFVLPEVTNK